MTLFPVIVMALSLKHKTSGLVHSYQRSERSLPKTPLKRKQSLFLANNSSANCAYASSTALFVLAALSGGHSENESRNEIQARSNLRARSPFLASQYYLIWSSGFVQKFALTSMSLWGIHVLQWDVSIAKFLRQQWQAVTELLRIPCWKGKPWTSSVTPNVLLPLLSSSCCLLQLFINILVGAGGCAGFNTILGPIRPFFLAVLVVLNVFANATLSQSLLRYGVALLPEGVHLWNVYKTKRLGDRHCESILAEPYKIRATLLVEIPTMGCVACINKIDSSLRVCSPDHILSASSWLEAHRKGGTAKVEVAATSEDELSWLSRTVVEAIDGAGFHGSVVTTLHILES